MEQKRLFEEKKDIPLAERMRPKKIEEMVGIDHLLGEKGFIYTCIKMKVLPSTIFWGPPGCGKTTLAQLLAKNFQKPFLKFSAVTSGIKEIKDAIKLSRQKEGLILFIDEIHRFNKAQQDAFLKDIEEGNIILLGATTENPSFELNPPLLSRVKVVVMRPLSEEELRILIDRALSDKENGIRKDIKIDESGYKSLIIFSGGDARKLYNLLEMASEYDFVNKELIEKLAQIPIPVYDKAGEEHFNLISALHKSIRNSDPDASLYWLLRMLIAGEDPLYIARRLIRCAMEDIGMADPYALNLAISAKEAVHFLGMPEGGLALANLVIYLALSPKSNSSYIAYQKAEEIAKKTSYLPVPLQIRNAPTELMEKLGYGEGYLYAHDFEEGVAPMVCLPEEIKNEIFYVPKEKGFEKKLKDFYDKVKKYYKI